MAIGIMACRKLVNKCSGTKCFSSYYENKDSFSIYKDKKEMLSSFFYCVGCEDTNLEGEDWDHKINQLKNNEIDTIHIALCIKVECDNYDKHENILKKEGFKVVKGTHK